MKTKCPKTTLTVKIILGLFLVLTGGMGLMGAITNAPVPPSGDAALDSFMAAIIATGWLFGWVSLFKLITGILLWIPRTSALAVLMLVPFAVNILLYTIFTAPMYFVMGFVLAALNAFLVYSYWENYKGIFK